MPQLLTNASATGSGFTWPGGTGSFEATATAWNGGSVTLQRLDQTGTWIDVSTDTVISSGTPGLVAFMLPPCQLRAAVALATGVNAAAWKIR